MAAASFDADPHASARTGTADPTVLHDAMTGPARRLLASSAVGVLLLAGCSESSGPLDRPEPESPRPDMTFTAEFHQTDTTVGWSWTLRNDDDECVLVFAGPDTERVSADEPPPTWVLGAKGNTVELAQRLLATPKNVDFAWPYGVAAQILEPGDELTGTAEASLPLTTTLPWGADVDPSQEVPGRPSEVYLCVGVGTVEGFPYPLTDGNDPYEIHGEFIAPKQHQYCTDTEPLR